jgi:LPXTG-motif cell wall-anchored protein
MHVLFWRHILRKLLLLAALAVASAPVSVIAHGHHRSGDENCQQSGEHEGNNSGCTVTMDDGDSFGLTAGTAALACLAGYFILRRRKSGMNSPRVSA